LEPEVCPIADTRLIEDLEEVDPAQRRQDKLVNLASDESTLEMKSVPADYPCRISKLACSSVISTRSSPRISRAASLRCP
jgi:hypothetical protein